MATKILIALNVLVMLAFAIANPTGVLVPDRQSLLAFGANYGLYTCSGEQWRLFTSMFLHVGVLHLLVNMYALYKVGPPAEDLFGWRTFLVIYVFSGLVGSLASCLWNPTLTSAGASGAIFGVYGSLLAFMYVQRDQFPKKTLHNHALMAVIFLICNFAYGWIVPEIDSFAHMGGLLAGAFSGFLFAHLQVKEKYRFAYIIPVLVLVTAGVMAITQTAFERRGYNFYYDGMQALKHNDYVLAVECLSLFLAAQPNDVEACGLRGFANLKLNDLHQAASDFSRVMALAPRSAQAYNGLAWVECGLMQFDKAARHASDAIRLSPKFALAYDTRGYAYARLGQVQKAGTDFDTAVKLLPRDAAARFHRRELLPPQPQVIADKHDEEISRKYVKEVWE